MPTFKEHAKLVDPSDLVVGRRYLVTYIQNEYPPLTGVLFKVDVDIFHIRVIHHRDHAEGRELFCALDGKHFFNLDDVMEEV